LKPKEKSCSLLSEETEDFINNNNNNNFSFINKLKKKIEDFYSTTKQCSK
jgi:hypothetical protein